MMDITMNQEYGTKWFTFYTKVRPWLSLIGFIALLNNILDYPQVYLYNIWFTISMLVSVALIILYFSVRAKSKGNYVEFVRFVKNVLLAEIFAFAYQFSLNFYYSNEMGFNATAITFAICLALGYFIWYRLNVKYFEKRIMQAPLIVETFSELPACPNCGTELLPGSNFCRKCGATIAQEINSNDTPNA